MTPQTLYARLNRLFWRGRLPDATAVLVDDATLPTEWGITLREEDCFMHPLIALNTSKPGGWGKILIHEMLHVAEPELKHGDLYEALVCYYWARAQREITDLKRKTA